MTGSTVDRRTVAGRALRSAPEAINTGLGQTPSANSQQASATEAAQDQTSTTAVPKVLRRKRAASGGFKVRLDAPARPGYVRRYVTDDPSRIAAMQDLGYQFADEDLATDGQGTRHTRHAGKDESGRPYHLVLMETPVEEYAVGVTEKEERLAPFEFALRAGKDTTGKLEGGYSPAAKSSLKHSG